MTQQWGTADDKTSTGTVSVDAAGVVTGVSTSFTTEAAVGDYITTDAEKLCIVSITSTTACQVAPQTLGGAIATAAANAYTLQEGPSYVALSEVGANAAHIFGVDTTEVGVTAGIASAGWVRRTVGTGNKSGIVSHEVLVASRLVSDADDDSVLPDA
jgi:hypothetical protein